MYGILSEWLKNQLTQQQQQQLPQQHQWRQQSAKPLSTASWNPATETVCPTQLTRNASQTRALLMVPQHSKAIVLNALLTTSVQDRAVTSQPTPAQRRPDKWIHTLQKQMPLLES